MPVEIRGNLVSFTPTTPAGGVAVYLDVRGGWSATPGLRPDVNTATVLPSEYAKLPQPISNVRGTIHFEWSSGGVDQGVTLHNVELLAAVPVTEGRRPGQATAEIVEWELHFADARHAYAEPRGGRLFLGTVNPEPARPADTLAPNSELLDACTLAMGGFASAVPANVDAVAPARDLQWDGAHAPTELSKLLQHVGAVFCPHSSGLGTVQIPNAGLDPTFPAGTVVSDLPAGGGDRRPSTLALISAPTAVTLTFTHEAGADAPGWTFVAQDANGFWLPLSEHPDLSADPAADVRNGFKDVPEARRDLLAKQAFRVIRMDPDAVPARHAPILGEVYFADGSQGEPHLRHTLARQIGTGGEPRWRNVADSVVYPAAINQEHNLLVFAERLGRVEADDVEDLDANFEAITAADLRPTYTVESYNTQDNRRELYGAAYGVNALGGVTASAASVESLTTGWRPDVAIHCCPELRLIRVNGTDANLADCNSRAAQLAAALAPAIGTPRTVVLKGLHPVELSGRISGVRWSPRDGRTLVEIDGYATPTPMVRQGAFGGGGGSGGSGGGGGVGASGPAVSAGAAASPSPLQQPARTTDAAQQRAAAQRQKAGASGKSQVSRPVRPTPQASGPAIVRVKVTAAKASLGWYDVTILKGVSALNDAAALTDAALGAVGRAASAYFPPDVQAGEHQLEDGAIYSGVLRGETSGGTPAIEIFGGAGGGGGIVHVEITGDRAAGGSYPGLLKTGVTHSAPDGDGTPQTCNAFFAPDLDEAVGRLEAGYTYAGTVVLGGSTPLVAVHGVGIPRGTAQYQTLQMTTATQLGWDYPRFA